MKQPIHVKSVDSYFTSIIEESVKATLQRKALQEKEKQDGASSSSKPEQTSNTPDEERMKLKKGNITVDDIIDKLNTIRSGKSFNDEEVEGVLTQYVDNLSVAEKTALLAFLKGISQVVTGEIAPEEAINPGSKTPGIEMEKKADSKKASIKPNVIKAPDIEKNEKASSEDTSGPVPIKPKR